jgi:hypothetical protein
VIVTILEQNCIISREDFFIEKIVIGSNMHYDFIISAPQWANIVPWKKLLLLKEDILYILIIIHFLVAYPVSVRCGVLVSNCTKERNSSLVNSL